MSPSPNLNRCESAELTCAYVLQVLPKSEAPRSRHTSPRAGLSARVGDAPAGGQSVRLLAHRRAAANDIAAGAACASRRGGDGETAGTAAGAAVSEPEWEQVAPGIECKLLATDTQRHRVSMLVRLAPARATRAYACGP